MSWPSYSWRERGRQLVCGLRHVRRPWELWSAGAGETFTVELRSGLRLSLRSRNGMSVADANILAECLLDDDYRLADMVHPGDVVVDVGAHVGIFTLLAASQAPGVRVEAYEPEPENFTLLARNVCQNPGAAVRLHNEAVSGAVGMASLWISADNTGAHSLLGLSGVERRVPCVDLPEILGRLPEGRIDLLKLDCEGSEYDILLHCPPVILSRIDRIVMELHDTPQTRAHSADELLDHLRRGRWNVETCRTIRYEEEGEFHLVHAVREDRR